MELFAVHHTLPDIIIIWIKPLISQNELKMLPIKYTIKQRSGKDYLHDLLIKKINVNNLILYFFSCFVYLETLYPVFTRAIKTINSLIIIIMSRISIKSFDTPNL